MDLLHCTDCDERFHTASPAWMVRNGRPCPQCGGPLEVADVAPARLAPAQPEPVPTAA
jgi:hypothetical protein